MNRHSIDCLFVVIIKWHSRSCVRAWNKTAGRIVFVYAEGRIAVVVGGVVPVAKRLPSTGVQP
jgi:hypothetical protein